MNYKKISKVSIVAFLALAIASPSVSLAFTPGDNQSKREERQEQREAQRAENQANREAKKEENQAQRTEKTCTQISSQADQIQTRLNTRITELTKKRTEAETKIQQQIAARSSELAKKRSSIDETKNLNWEKLRAAAKTDEQKAAVEKFVTAVQNAIKIKRAAIDKIILDFRTGLQTERANRKTETDATLTTYKNSVATIAAQVKTDCSSGKSPQEIRETFRTSLQNARNTFQANRKPAEKFRSEVTPLKEAKKAELKAVIDTFQASIESAKKELQSAFPKTEPATTPTTNSTTETENE